MKGDFYVADWLVQPSLSQISRDGRHVHVRAKVMDLLVVLANHSGEVVTKQVLLDEVWRAEAITESALTRTMTELRQALDDDVEQPAYLETIAKRGYRLIAPVQPPQDLAPAVAAPVQAAEASRSLFPIGGLGAWVALLFVAAAATVLLVARYATMANAGSAPSSNRPVIKSLAVLPLRNLTGDARQDWFTESLTQELTSATSQIGGLRVISGISARQYKGSLKTAPEIARELGGIDGLLEGSVTRDGDSLRIAVYLDEPAGNRRIWADTYERSLGDSPHLLQEIAGRVALAMGATLTTTEEARLTAAGGVTPDAYEAYLHGLYFRERQMDGGCVAAEPYFLRAIAIDGAFAPPHAVLAYCYGANRFNGQLPAADALARGHAALGRALELNPQLAEAHVSLALIRHRTEYDWPGAERSFKRALALRPSDAEGLVRYGEWLYMSGRVDEGLAMIQRGVELVPFNIDYRLILEYAFYNLRRLEASLAQGHAARKLDPNRPYASWGLAQSYALQQRHDEAVADSLAALRLMLMPQRATAADLLESAYQRGGWKEFWQSELRLEEEGIRTPEAVWLPPYRRRMVHFHIARNYARLGERDRAIASLEAAYTEREGNLVFIGLEPLFESLHADPRFRDLARRVGLKP